MAVPAEIRVAILKVGITRDVWIRTKITTHKRSHYRVYVDANYEGEYSTELKKSSFDLSW